MGRFHAMKNELKAARRLLRHEGFRALLHRYGWKLIAVIFAYYVVRDITLYVILPIFLFKSWSPR